MLIIRHVSRIRATRNQLSYCMSWRAGALYAYNGAATLVRLAKQASFSAKRFSTF